MFVFSYLVMSAIKVCIRRNTVVIASLEQRLNCLKSIQCVVSIRKMATQLLDEDTPIIALDESNRFITECLQAAGTPYPHAKTMANILVEADYRGHYSHGMNRLDMYIKDITSQTCDCKASPKILKETAATAWVCGQNGLGGVVGDFCMDLAMKKAKEVGVGWVVARLIGKIIHSLGVLEKYESNHYGIAGWYSLQAIKQGLIGMSFTNTSPFMSPTRSKKAALGTNPIAVGAPAKNEDSFVLDMATTAVAVGKIEMQRRKALPIPEGWALDEEGNVTSDTEKAYEAGRLMPLGGAELNSGYKGYGLGFLVELFCGILGGAAYGPNIRMWGDKAKVANLGQCFVAINPTCFAPGFEDRLSDFMDLLRNMEPVDPNKPVLVAGDPERQHMDAVHKAGGVKYVPHQMKTCAELAKNWNVKPLQPAS